MGRYDVLLVVKNLESCHARLKNRLVKFHIIREQVRTHASVSSINKCAQSDLSFV